MNRPLLRIHLGSRHALVAAPAVLLACALAVTAAAPAFAREPTATEVFAWNVFHKNYVIGRHPKTTIQGWSWTARCRRVQSARVPTATCSLSWNSKRAHWTARGRFRGAVRIGPPPYKRFSWKFSVKSRCVGEACAAFRPNRRVRRHVWKGTGLNTPA